MRERDELKELWQQDDDLERIETFFQAIDPSIEDKERIKQLTLAKLNQPSVVPSLNTQPSKNIINRLVYGKAKYGIAVAAVCLVALLAALDQNQTNDNADAGMESANSATPLQDMVALSEPPALLGEQQSMMNDEDPALSDNSQAKIALAPADPSQEMLAMSAIEEEPRTTTTVKANIVLEVANPDQAMKQIASAVEQYGGKQISTSGTTSLDLALPQEQFEPFTSELESLGVIESFDTFADSATAQKSDSKENESQRPELQDEHYRVHIELVPRP